MSTIHLTYESWADDPANTQPYQGKHVAFVNRVGVVVCCDTLGEAVQKAKDAGTFKNAVFGYIPRSSELLPQYAGTLTIKPLQWKQTVTGGGYVTLWDARLAAYNSFATLYEIRSFEDQAGFFLWFCAISHMLRVGDTFPTLEAAQAAAQVDWERFIGAAVEAS